jgi:hypothetical protein
MAWLVFSFTVEVDWVLAANDYLAIAIAMDKGHHLLKPRLARIACQSIAETRGLAAAQEVADKVLAVRTADPAFDELELWMTWHEQAAVAASRAQQPRNITHRRLARPEGRVNSNPYLPR